MKITIQFLNKTHKQRFLRSSALWLAAVGLSWSASAQIQVAGTLQVNVDAVTQPVGAVTYITNSGAAGGVFLATNNAVAGITPQIVALGGNGTHGFLGDGNATHLRHFTAPNGVPQNPPSTFVGTSPIFSVEAWVCKATIPDDQGVVSWGNRSTKNAICCNYGANANYGGFSFFGGDYGWTTLPAARTWHHLAWTYDGAGTLVLYRDGVLDRTVTGITALNITSTNILICAEHSGTSYAIFGTELIGRVRIHDGVLAAGQVAANYAYEAPAFTNGTGAAMLTSAPLHRYSFTTPPTNNCINLNVTDTGRANGTAKQADAMVKSGTNVAAAMPYATGTGVYLTGGTPNTNSYIDIPKGLLVNSLSTSNGGPGAVSFELWATQTRNLSWSRFFDFGSNTVGKITGPSSATYTGAHMVLVASQSGTDLNHVQISPGTGINFGSYVYNLPTHFVLTWDEASGVLTAYENGVVMASLTTSTKLNAIWDVNDWIGRSNWNGDNEFGGGFSEFRLYDRVLNPTEVLLNYRMGPYVAVEPNTIAWTGGVDGNWNTGVANWVTGAAATNYVDGDVIVFNDGATNTTVNIPATVAPGRTVTFANATKNYTITGPGNITGPVGLTKGNSGTVTMTGTQTNDYTGSTVLAGGILSVSNLGNGGAPSAIGASASNAWNLVFSGGGLRYTGPATSIDRGYQVAGPTGTLDLQSDLTLGGTILADLMMGNFIKTGPATLTYNGLGSNTLSGGLLPGYNIAQGAVVFYSANGKQTNHNLSEFWVGGTPATGASLVVSNSTLVVDSWLSVGRGNGSVGNLSTLTLNSGNVTAGNATMGYDGGTAGNNARQLVTLNGTSMYYSGGSMTVGESAGSTGTLNVNDTSWVRGNPTRLGLNPGATGYVYLANSAALTNVNWLSIGTGGGSSGPGSGGYGVMVVKDNAILSSAGDFNVSDITYSSGELDVSNNAQVIINGAVYIGKSGGAVGVVNQYGGIVNKVGGGDVRIGGTGSTADSGAVGTYNLFGGILNLAGGYNLQPGSYGTGTFNQSGGTNIVGGWPSIGRFGTGSGTYNITGGYFIQNGAGGQAILVGEQGTGSLNISGTGTVVSHGTSGLGIGWNAGNGSVYLNGGTLITRIVQSGPTAPGMSAFYFNGGVLQANTNAFANFMQGLSQAQIFGGGAFIDSFTNNITISQDILSDGGPTSGLTKLGLGTLTMSGNLYYTGPTVVTAGKLALNAPAYVGAWAPGVFTVADGAELSVALVAQNTGLVAPALTLGATTGATIDIGLGSFGNPASAAVDVSAGTLTLNGAVTLNIDPLSTLSVGQIPLIAYGTIAGAGNFVLGTLPPGVFGNLYTNTAVSPNWIGLNITSVFLPQWQGLAGGTWDITVTTNWIDQATGDPEFYYQGCKAVFNDLALGTTSVSLVTNVSPGGVLVSNSALNYTISGSGKISGGNGLTKLGTGTLTLSTTNNNYTGPTLIDEGGTLISTAPNNLGTNNALIIANGTLSLGTNSQKSGTVWLTNGAVVAAGATVTAGAFNLDNGSVGATLAGGSLVTIGTNTDLVTVLGANTYTGRTVLAGSILAVPALANGGQPSGIGAASSSPTNLIFSGGGLAYTGAGATTDHGYTVQAGGSLSVSGNVVLGGSVGAVAGNFAKGGLAALTYTALGTNVLSRGGGAGAYAIGAGTVMFTGGASSSPTNYLQTNYVVGEFWVGNTTTNAAALILTNTSLGISSWFSVDRGNGTSGFQSTANLYDSYLSCANYSAGYDAGILGNNTHPLLSLHNRSRVVIPGVCYIGESAGSDAYLFINDTSAVTVAGATLLGRNTATSTGTVVIANSGSLSLTGGWLSVGAAGNGSLTLQDNAFLNVPVDENVADTANSTGVYNLAGNATNYARGLWVGKSTGSIGTVNQTGGFLGQTNANTEWRIGGNTAADTNAVGTYNLSGGLLAPTTENFQVGCYGTGYFNQSGGTFLCSAWPSFARFPGGVGILNISGGLFNHTGTGTRIVVGEQGTATLTITNTALVITAGGVSIGHTATGVGVLNLDGGTLVTPLIAQVGGTAASGTFNFNGGLLQAGTNATAAFMTGLTAANVQLGGARIDSGTNVITIAQALLDGGTGGGLTKFGTGSLTLSGANTYTGLTAISNGTLVVNGGVASSVTAGLGSTLNGSGIIGGPVTIQPGATLAPGTTALGTLVMNSSLTLDAGAAAYFQLNKSLVTSNSAVAAAGPVVANGALTVTNLGPALVAGDRFQLFSVPVGGAFTSVVLPSGYNWVNNLAVDGSISVASVIVPIPTTPTNITWGISGGNYTLSWPSNYVGWSLQTNAVSLLSNTLWFPWPGSTTTNLVTLPIDKAQQNVFFRLSLH